MRVTVSLSLSLSLLLILGLLGPAERAIGGTLPRCYQDVPIVVKDGFNLALGGATVSLDQPSLACGGGPTSATTAADTGIALLNINGDAVEGAKANVTASKPGHEPQTKQITISPIALPGGTQSQSQSSSGSQSADLSFAVSNNTFTLLYSLTVSQTRPALRSGETMTINVSAVVPPASAGADRAGRIIATAADGTRTEFTQGATTGAVTSWSLLIAPPSGAAEGPVTLTICAVNNTYVGNCGGASPANVLSLKPTVTYTIDDTAPALLAGRIRPLDGGNTMFDSQRLQVPLTELGSGVDLTTLRFDLIDETTSTATNYTDTQVSLDVTKKWAQTVPVALTRGHLYRVGVTVKDLAGNETVVAQAPVDQGGGWLAMEVTAPGVTRARIRSVDCAVEPDPTPPNSDLKKNATCSGMKVEVDPATVRLSGTRHGGTGRIGQRIPIGSALVAPSALGQYLPPVKPYASDAAQGVTQEFFVPDGTALPLSAEAGATEQPLPPVTIRVPHGTTNATLAMANTSTIPSSVACEYAIGVAWCAPDPIPPVAAESSNDVLDVVTLPGRRVAALLTGHRSAVIEYGTRIVRDVASTQVNGEMSIENTLTVLGPESVSTASEADQFAAQGRAGWRDETARRAVGLLGATDSAVTIVPNEVVLTILDMLGSSTEPESGDSTPVCVYDDAYYRYVGQSGVIGKAYDQTGCWGSDPGDETGPNSDPNALAPYGARNIGRTSHAIVRPGEHFATTSELIHHLYAGGAFIHEYEPSSGESSGCHGYSVGISGGGFSVASSGTGCESTTQAFSPTRRHLKVVWAGTQARDIQVGGVDHTRVPHSSNGDRNSSGFVFKMSATVHTYGCGSILVCDASNLLA